MSPDLETIQNEQANDGNGEVGLAANRSSAAKNVLLALLGVASILMGFALGRSLRSAPAVPAAGFPTVAPTGAVAGAGLLGGNHGLLGTIPPAFELTDLRSGQAVSLSDYEGRPVLVSFWATWCPPCRLEMPWLQAAHEKHGESGLAVLGVNAGERVAEADAPATIRGFGDSYGLTFPLLHGASIYDLQTKWSVWGLPATFLLDPEHRVVDAQIGAYPSQDEMERRIAALMGGAGG